MMSLATFALTLPIFGRIGFVMRTHCLLVLVLVVASACDRGAMPKKPDCSGAVAVLARSEPGVTLTEEQRSNLKAMIANRCSEDQWSDQAVACVAKAIDAKSQRECMYKHLTQEQQDKLDRATRPLRGDAAQRALAKLTEFKDSMCACKDAACPQRVTDEMTKWSQEAAESREEPPRLTQEQTSQAAAIGEEMGKCMQVAMGASTGTDQAELDLDAVRARMSDFKDQMCACKDATCATRVSDDMTKWSQAMSKSQKNPPRMSKDDQKKVEAIGHDMGVCMQAAMSKR